MEFILITYEHYVYYSLIIHVHYFLICTLWYDDFHEFTVISFDIIL